MSISFGERAFPGVGQKRAEETRIAELERKIGQQVLEILFERERGSDPDFQVWDACAKLLLPESTQVLAP